MVRYFLCIDLIPIAARVNRAICRNFSTFVATAVKSFSKKSKRWPFHHISAENLQVNFLPIARSSIWMGSAVSRGGSLHGGVLT